MSIQDQTPTYVQYIGDGIQTIFFYPFQVDEARDLRVYLNGILETGYTLTGLGLATGGTVVFFAAPALGVLVHIERHTLIAQFTDFTPNDPFDARAQEAEHDNSRMIDQDVYTVLSRVPEFEVAIPEQYRNMLLPTPVPLKLLGYDSNGILTLFDSAIVTVQASGATPLVQAMGVFPVTAVPGATALSIPVAMPAGALGVGAVFRVTTPFGTSNGLTTISIGDSGTIDAWGSGWDPVTASPLLITNPGGWHRQPWFSVPSALTVFISADNGAHFDTVGAGVLTTAYFMFVAQ